MIPLDELDGPSLRAMRLEAGKSAEAWWSPLGVPQPTAHSYETGRTMPAPLQRLAWLHYVVGIPTNGDPQMLAIMARFGRHAVAAALEVDEARRRTEQALVAFEAAITAARQDAVG